MSDWSQPGLSMAMPTIIHQDGVESVLMFPMPKIHIKAYFIVGTWNIRTLHMPGKVHELNYKMNRYQWDILSLCET